MDKDGLVVFVGNSWSIKASVANVLKFARAMRAAR